MLCVENAVEKETSPRKNDLALIAGRFYPETTMVEFPFGRCSKRCQIQNRPLLPGERYYSVAIAGKNLDDEDEQVSRFDVAASAWTGPPENAIGWWMKEMPRVEQMRVRPAKPTELLDRLTILCDSPSEAPLASLLATLLVRKRILAPNPNPSDSCPEGFIEYVHRGSSAPFCVPTNESKADEELALQTRLQQLLLIEVGQGDSE